jgi:hypothetical protein
MAKELANLKVELVDEVVVESVGRSCPACDGELEPHPSYRDSLQCGCGWLLVVPVG